MFDVIPTQKSKTYRGRILVWTTNLQYLQVYRKLLTSFLKLEFKKRKEKLKFPNTFNETSHGLFLDKNWMRKKKNKKQTTNCWNTNENPRDEIIFKTRNKVK